MPRPTTERVRRVTDQLRHDITTSIYQRGDEFPSARAISRRHGVSYQTAHRVIRQLADEGLLVTRHGSGTFVADAAGHPTRVELRFNRRAERPRSFGAALLSLLGDQLSRQGIPFEICRQGAPPPDPDVFSVTWEDETERDTTTDKPGTFGLALNDRRVHGLAATRIDTVCVDDFSGGVCAAQIIRDQFSGRRTKTDRVAILAATDADERSNDRVRGFRSSLAVGRQDVVEAGGWTDADAEAVATDLLAREPRFVFCCNDRLAAGLLEFCRRDGRETPAIVGFDNAPVAEDVALTTVGIPWREFVAAAVEVIAKRVRGDRSIARRQVFPLQPVLRASHRPGWAATT